MSACQCREVVLHSLSHYRHCSHQHLPTLARMATLQTILEENSDTSNTFSTIFGAEYDFRALNDVGETVLHVVLQWSELNIELILELISIYPEAAGMCCLKGNIPLHLYCSRDSTSSDITILRALLGAFPDGVHLRNKPKKNFLRPLLPIEIAMRSKNDETFELLWQLASETDRAALRADWLRGLVKGDITCRYQNNNTALHHVIWAHKVSQHVLFILRSYTDAVWCLNVENHSPLDLALLCGYFKEEVIRAIVRQMAHSARQHKSQQRRKQLPCRQELSRSADMTYPTKEKVLCAREWQLFRELNWRARRAGMLVAYRMMGGAHVKVLSRIARFL